MVPGPGLELACPAPTNLHDVRHWLLLALLLAMALVEKVLRPELPLTSFLFGIALMPTLIWRRSKPLRMVLIAFVATGIASATEIVTGGDFPVPHTSVFMLLLPFALVRWGTGRDVTIGLPIVLTSASLASPSPSQPGPGSRLRTRGGRRCREDPERATTILRSTRFG